MFTKTPWLFRILWPGRIWRKKGPGKNLYLTFDDGPTPGVTDQVLDLLDKYNAKATFFVVGSQVERHRELFREIMRRGHAIGSHSYNHPRSSSLSSADFLQDIEQCNALLQEELGHPPTYFRPPYGRIRSRDARRLAQQIVMWDVLPGDWRADYSGEQIVSIVQEKSRPGSIVVLHDSEKAADRLLYALPRILDHFHRRDYKFQGL